MRAAIGWFVLAALIYFGSRTDAPTPERIWEPYATNSATGKLEWVLAGPYTTYGECTFNAEKAIKNSAYYREPMGCLYRGYQNPYVQWIVNTAIGWCRQVQVHCSDEKPRGLRRSTLWACFRWLPLRSQRELGLLPLAPWQT